MIKFYLLLLGVLLPFLVGLTSASLVESKTVVNIEEPTFNADAAFQTAIGRKGNLMFSDDCTGDWQQKWSKDGLKAKVLNTSKGMYVCAGQDYLNDADHVVMWTKLSFEGSIIIEYDFTRLDTATRVSVNILYIQAQGSGKGAYKKDLFEWNSLRKIPAMNIYFDHTDAYHISYATSGAKSAKDDDYIRARRYMPETGQHLKGTALRQEYFDSGFFKTGVRYRLTIIKENKSLLFNVKGDEKEQTFYFTAEGFPPIEAGRIGLRQMFTRNSLYANFKVFQLQ